VDVEDRVTAESFELYGADRPVRNLPSASSPNLTSRSLLRHRSHLADAAQQICRDCA
jgi:hypothetical protein